MGPLKIHNNGHSVSLIVPKPENSSEFPYIFGGKLRAEFEFVGLHFHWGDKNNRGAVRLEFLVENFVLFCMHTTQLK
jgi:carbonic anhydrase